MHKLEIPIPISTATAISFLLIAMRSAFAARKRKRSEFIRATGDNIQVAVPGKKRRSGTSVECSRSDKSVTVRCACAELGASHNCRPQRLSGVYSAHEEGQCCNKWTKRRPETSSGLVRQFPQWMNPAILPQLSIAAFVDGGSVLSMLRTIAGTSAFSSRVKKVGRRRS